MPDEQCDCLRNRFDTKVAEEDLRDYRRNGPDRTTQQLIDRLLAAGVADRTLIDVGGGIGAIQLELLARGLGSAIDVDVSEAYVDVARREAAARGFAPRVDYRVGDFVTIADHVPAADLVTLDRVICCYPDLDRLAMASAARAELLLGLVHPQDRWWLRAGTRAMNAISGLFRQPRFYVHSTARLESILRASGFERDTVDGGFFWRVAVYRRVRPAN
jgi:magnesium-protoporphyrin O-methyltransferase